MVFHVFIYQDCFRAILYTFLQPEGEALSVLLLGEIGITLCSVYICNMNTTLLALCMYVLYV